MALRIIEFIPNLRTGARKLAKFTVEFRPYDDEFSLYVCGELLRGSGSSVYARPTVPVYGQTAQGGRWPVSARWPVGLEERVQQEAARFWQDVGGM